MTTRAYSSAVSFPEGDCVNASEIVQINSGASFPSIGISILSRARFCQSLAKSSVLRPDQVRNLASILARPTGSFDDLQSERRD